MRAFWSVREAGGGIKVSHFWIVVYRGSPNSTNFGPPGDRTIAKIVLSGD